MRKDQHSWMRISLNDGKDGFLSFLCFLIIFIYSWAAKTSDALSPSFLQDSLTVLAIMIVGMIFIVSPKKINVSTNKTVIFIVLLIYLAIQMLYIEGSVVLARGITTLMCIVLLSQTEFVQARAFQMLKGALAISCVIGIILWLLLLVGFHGSILGDPHSVGREYVSYFIAYFCRTREFWRYCGFYNEPGALGTFCALFLCADSVNLRKKENVALLIGGIMSFSIAFYVIVGLFVVMRSATNWKKWLFIVFIVSFYLFVLPNIHTGNLAVDTIVRRLTFDGESLSGDNRTNYILDMLYEETIHSDYILFGRKLGFANRTSRFSVNMVGPSIKTYIIDLGLVGTLLLFVPLCITEIIRSKHNKDGIFYVIVTFFNLYQRAYLLHNTIYFTALIYGLSYILLRKELDDT